MNEEPDLKGIDNNVDARVDNDERKKQEDGKNIEVGGDAGKEEKYNIEDKEYLSRA